MNVHYCVLFSSTVMVTIGVRIRFSVWLVSCYAHEFVPLSIVIVTLPTADRHVPLTLIASRCWAKNEKAPNQAKFAGFASVTEKFPSTFLHV